MPFSPFFLTYCAFLCYNEKNGKGGRGMAKGKKKRPKARRAPLSFLDKACYILLFVLSFVLFHRVSPFTPATVLQAFSLSDICKGNRIQNKNPPRDCAGGRSVKRSYALVLPEGISLPSSSA
jgi:hypothetical protein